MILDVKHRNLIAFLIPLSLVTILFLVVKSITVSTNASTFYNAVVLDLVIAIPLIYFFLIRKLNIPKTTVVPVFIIGIIIASYIIPSEHQSLLSIVKTWMIPIVEISVLTYVIISIRKGLKSFKRNKIEAFDFFSTLKTSVGEIMPKRIAHFFAMEVATVYYGFFHWKKLKLKPNAFTYHKNSGVITLFIAFVFIIAIETIVFHLVLVKWNVIVAWILTALSIYTGAQFLGFAKSTAKRPILLIENKLHLYFGIMSETVIDTNEIESIEFTSKEIEFNKDTRQLSPLVGMVGHNIILTLKNPQKLSGFYGIKKTYKTLAFYVDTPQVFKQAIENLSNEII